MPFVFKGDVPHYVFDQEQSLRIYDGLNTIRLVTGDRFIDFAPSDSLFRDEIFGFDLTTQSEFEIISAFIGRAFVRGNGELVDDLVLIEAPFTNSQSDQYRIQLNGALLPHPDPGDPITEYFDLYVGDVVDNPGMPDLDLAANDRLEFLGETDVSLLSGTDAEREARAESIAYLYEAGLDRDGNIDEGGLNFWIDAAGDGFSDRQLAQAFLASPEFEAAFGAPETLSDEEFVEQLYRNVLDRGSDQAGFDFWFDTLERVNGQRDVLLIAFAQSEENIAGSPGVAGLAETEPGIWEFLA